MYLDNAQHWSYRRINENIYVELYCELVLNDWIVFCKN